MSPTTVTYHDTDMYEAERREFVSYVNSSVYLRLLLKPTGPEREARGRERAVKPRRARVDRMGSQRHVDDGASLNLPVAQRGVAGAGLLQR